MSAQRNDRGSWAGWHGRLVHEIHQIVGTGRCDDPTTRLAPRGERPDARRSRPARLPTPWPVGMTGAAAARVATAGTAQHGSRSDRRTRYPQNRRLVPVPECVALRECHGCGYAWWPTQAAFCAECRALCQHSE